MDNPNLIYSVLRGELRLSRDYKNFYIETIEGPIEISKLLFDFLVDLGAELAPGPQAN